MLRTHNGQWIIGSTAPLGGGRDGGARMRVLLADDDRVLTHLLSTKLRRLGVEIVFAHDTMQVPL